MIFKCRQTCVYIYIEKEIVLMTSQLYGHTLVTPLEWQMVKSCVAFGCSNRSVKGSGLLFIVFQLILNVGRSGTPTKHSWLCSSHFISGSKSDHPLNPDYVPSLFQALSKEERGCNCNCFVEGKRLVCQEQRQLHMIHWFLAHLRLSLDLRLRFTVNLSLRSKLSLRYWNWNQ